ncbi:MAG TPA: hypothetical protein VIK45_08140 [Candidatus Dormibacteraeota bacterium]
MIDERNRRRLRQALVEPFGPPSPELERIMLASLERSPVRRTSTRVLALAVFLVFMALAASIALAGHVLRDNSGPASPSPQQVAKELAQLRQRPLNLPALGPNGTCPETPLNQTVSRPLYANHGPIYGEGGPEVTGDHGYYYHVTWLSDAKYKGLALVRGRRLDGAEQIIFAGPLAAGSFVTTDTIGGTSTRFFDELVLPPGPQSGSAWRQWPVLQGVPSAGCYGFQLDGPVFHDFFVVNVAPGG